MRIKKHRLTNSQKRKCISAVLCTILAGTLSAACIYLYRNGAADRISYEYSISELKGKISQASRCIPVAACDLEAGEVLGASNVTSVEVLKSYGESFSEEDCYGKCVLTAVTAGSELTQLLLYTPDFFENEREVRFEDILLSSNIGAGDYVDIRLKYPDGTDEVVLARKKVFEVDNFASTVDLHVSEEELERMNNAQAYRKGLNEGQWERKQDTVLYATKYISPQYQEASKVTYIMH